MRRQDVENTITEYLKPIFGFALKRCKNIHDAEDLSQEIVLKAFRALLAKEDIADMGKFIWTVAHVSNYYRDTAKSMIGVSIDEVSELIAAPDSFMEEDDNTQSIHRLLLCYTVLCRSVDFQLVFRRERRERRGRKRLIPVGDRGNVVFERQIAAAVAPAECLNRHAQIALKADRVGDVPAVHAEALVGVIQPVRRADIGEAGVRRRKGLVAVRILILKVVGAAEIILRPRAADGRVFAVAVHIKLDLALAPPAVVVDAPGQIGADVLPLALHVVEDRIDLFIGQRVDAPELRVKIGGVLGDVGQRIIDLIEKGGIFIADILQRHAAAPAERHLPVTVQGPPRIDADSQRRERAVLIPAAGEKVADRAFDARRLAPVPVDAQDQEAPVAGGRAPDMVDAAASLDVGERKGGMRLDGNTGIDLPALAEVAGAAALNAVFQLAHRALSLFSGKVFGADGARFGV